LVKAAQVSSFADKASNQDLAKDYEDRHIPPVVSEEVKRLAAVMSNVAIEPMEGFYWIRFLHNRRYASPVMNTKHEATQNTEY
jgi:hypothetical protein